jgi:hypothetical protein
MRALRSALCAACLLGAALPASAQVPPAPGEVPLADVLEIVQLEHELVALDAASGGQTTLALHLDETVLWLGSKGRVGVVLTDQRVLAVAVGSAAWQETRYRRSELPPASALLGDRVALVATAARAIGFDGGSGKLIEYDLGPNERLVDLRVAENVGLVVTDRVALGLSPNAGGFFESRLQPRERVARVDVRANLCTVTTDRRILIFRGPTASWSERRLDLDS